MSTYTVTESTVYHMERNMFKENSILYSDGSSLKKTSREGTFLITGDPLQAGYKDGKYGSALFSYITGFAQIPLYSRGTIVVVDKQNHCLRIIFRSRKRKVGTFAGECLKSGYKDSTSNMKKALFNQPHSIITDKKSTNRLFLTDTKNNAIRALSYHLTPANLTAGEVTSLAKSDENMYKPKGIIQVRDTGDFYISTASSIMRLTYRGHTLSHVASLSGANLMSSGPLIEAKLKYPVAMLMLNDGNMLIAGKWMRVIGQSSTDTICKGKSHTADGRLYSSVCSMKNPTCFLLIDDNLYIGQQGAIRRISRGVSHYITSLVSCVCKDIIIIICQILIYFYYLPRFCQYLEMGISIRSEELCIDWQRDKTHRRYLHLQQLIA